MALNTTSPTGFTGLVVAETVAQTGGSPDSLLPPELTKVNGKPIASLLEVRGTNGVFTFPRLTSAQLDAVVASTTTSITPGMMAFDKTKGTFVNVSGAGTTFTPMQMVEKKTITSAQLLDLNETPVDLLPAKGTGLVVVVDRIAVEYVHGTVVYTVPEESKFTFEIAGIPVASEVAAAGLVDQTANTLVITSNEDVDATPVSTFNVPLKITNTVGALTLGNGTLNVYVWYTVISG